MTAPQTAYSENITNAVNGMVADSIAQDIDTRICETAAGIGFGLAVAHGATEKGALLGGALNDFSGISIRSVTLPASNEDKYIENDNMGVLAKGDIWVVPAVAVVEGDPVHYNATTGQLTNTGGSGPIVGARWMKGGTALAMVRLGGGMPAA